MKTDPDRLYLGELIEEIIAGRKHRDGGQWEMGDAALKIEVGYGEADLQRAAERADVEYEQLRHYRWVAGAYESGVRTTLSWSHHERVAGRPDRLEWLARAEENGWSVRELLAELPQQGTRQPWVTHNSGEYEWYTPEDIADAARDVLGCIDLDPASTPEANAVIKAARFYTLEDDGLARPWGGRLFVNPPYAYGLIDKFADKMAAHVDQGDIEAAIVLVLNSTETGWFKTLQQRAAAVCFPSKRLHFWTLRGDAAAAMQGHALLYFGADVPTFAGRFAAFGSLWLRLPAAGPD